MKNKNTVTVSFADHTFVGFLRTDGFNNDGKRTITLMSVKGIGEGKTHGFRTLTQQNDGSWVHVKKPEPLFWGRFAPPTLIPCEVSGI